MAQPRRVLCVWLPNWPLQRLATSRAELKGRPTLIYELHPRGGLKVVDYSPALGIAPGCQHQYLRFFPATKNTRTAGIRPGMPLAEATSLAEWESKVGNKVGQPPLAPTSDLRLPTCLHLHFYDPHADRLALEELAEWSQRFSPIVGIEEGERPESLLMDVTGLAPLFGGEEQLAHRVERGFAARGLAAVIAVADTIGAAWAVGHTEIIRNSERGIRNVRKEERKSFAPLAPNSEFRIPNLRDLPPGRSWDALDPLPVAALRLTAETVALLGELGLRSIGQVAQLPRSMLTARFGSELLMRLDQAAGRSAEVIQARKLPPEWEQQWLLDHPTDRRETIEFVLEQLIIRLCDILARQHYGVLQLEYRFDYQSGRYERLHVGLFRASATAKHVWGLVQLQLEKFRLREPIIAIWATATRAGPLDFEQQSLLTEDGMRDAPRPLAALVDRLSSRLGRESVVRPLLISDAQPEYACHWLPMTGVQPVRKKKKPSSHPALFGPAERPLSLYRQPIPLAVVSVVPDGPPIQFEHHGCTQRVACTWGPERIETGWWRTSCVRRDYYRVETASGARYWLFRRLQDGRWFLQGEFD